eukprot:scaffold79777_cov63-Phaeocystis_antarctica.AAC.1
MVSNPQPLHFPKRQTAQLEVHARPHAPSSSEIASHAGSTPRHARAPHGVPSFGARLTVASLVLAELRVLRRRAPRLRLGT